MPFLLAEILDFQGSAHLIGVGSLSQHIIGNGNVSWNLKRLWGRCSDTGSGRYFGTADRRATDPDG